MSTIKITVTAPLRYELRRLDADVLLVGAYGARVVPAGTYFTAPWFDGPMVFRTTVSESGDDR